MSSFFEVALIFAENNVLHRTSIQLQTPSKWVSLWLSSRLVIRCQPWLVVLMTDICCYQILCVDGWFDRLQSRVHLLVLFWYFLDGVDSDLVIQRWKHFVGGIVEASLWWRSEEPLLMCVRASWTFHHTQFTAVAIKTVLFIIIGHIKLCCWSFLTICIVLFAAFLMVCRRNILGYCTILVVFYIVWPFTRNCPLFAGSRIVTWCC